jgi:hypothetical protein
MWEVSRKWLLRLGMHIWTEERFTLRSQALEPTWCASMEDWWIAGCGKSSLFILLNIFEWSGMTCEDLAGLIIPGPPFIRILISNYS